MVTKSYEDLASAALTFAGGDVRVVSTDDGINAAATGSSSTPVATAWTLTGRPS